MPRSRGRWITPVALLALMAAAAPVLSGDETPPAAEIRGQARAAAVRGLAFLEADAAKWRKERECSTCHHGTLTVWAFAEARRQGYPATAETLAEMARWTRERLLARIDLPRDTRPGWSMVSTPAIYLAVMALAVPSQDAVPTGELRRIAGHLVRHQEADGAWSWASAPPKNRPPPFFESDEVATLLASTALRAFEPAELKEAAAAPESRSRSAAWLRAAAPTDTTQAAAYRLLAKLLTGAATEERRPAVERLLERQRDDGGWSQVPNRASDAYATGQALYMLSLAGVKSDHAAIRRGAAFLVASQRPDGSWDTKPRSHPGATPANNPVPIIYFGSAWGTLGLMRAAAP